MHRYIVEYGFDDYLNSPYRKGYYDEGAQLWLVVPLHEVRERDGFLVIGRPGYDGVEFGYRRDERGIFAHYPIDDEYELIAPTVHSLVEKWASK